MAQKLNYKNIHPDIMISSPAKRAKSTAKTFKKILEFKDKIIFNDSIYHAQVHEIESIIKNLDNKYDSVFLFAHNPTINELVEDYVNMYENVPTCGIVGISFKCKEWKDSVKSDKELLFFDYPKNYKVDKEDEN